MNNFVWRLWYRPKRPPYPMTWHMYSLFLTSTISVTQIWKPPDVAQTHGEAEAGQQELYRVVPLPPLRIAHSGACKWMISWDWSFSLSWSPVSSPYPVSESVLSLSLAPSGGPGSARPILQLLTSWRANNEYFLEKENNRSLTLN